MMTNQSYGRYNTPQPSQNHCPPAHMPPAKKPPTPYTPPAYPPMNPPPQNGYPVKYTAPTPSYGHLSSYLNLEGKGPGGFLGDAMTGTVANSGANEQWKNYVIGSLGEAPKTFAPSAGDLVQCENGHTPTLEGGLAGDPQRYLVQPNADNAHFMPPAGTNLRVYQDEGITIDNHYDDINEGDQANNVAATQSMATITNPANGEQHKIFLNDGVTTYIKPDGSKQIISPDAKEPFIIGDPKDPLAKLEIKADNPGNVPITLTHYERYSPETLKLLQDKGIDPSAAMKVRLENEIRWGNRLTDGNGTTERAAAGTSSPVEVNQYYDMHVVNKGSEALMAGKAQGGTQQGNPYQAPPRPNPYSPPTETPKAEGSSTSISPKPKVPSASGNTGGAYNSKQATSAASVLANNPMYQTLLSLVKAAGLESELQTLEGKGDVTVLAPTEQAFSNLPNGLAAALLKPENLDVLKRILLYHISEPGAKLPNTGNRPTLFNSATSDDQNVFVRRGNRGNVINGKQITNAGKARQASNGSAVIPVNEVLVPPGLDLSKLL